MTRSRGPGGDMANATEAPLSGSAPAPRKGFRDSVGDRLIVAGAVENELLEVLHLRRELTAVPSFEFALRERAARLANFQHNAYARVRQIDRLPPPDGRLAIVSEHVPGWRLAEILSAVQERHLELDINAALSLVKQLVHGVAILHQHARGVAHGALGPERVVVTAHARLAIVEYVLGSALERLDMPREKLWRDLRIAIPPAAGAARIDPRADVTQLGTIAIALVLGCPLAADDYPDHMAELLAMATENRTLGGRRPLSKPLRAWLARALQLDLHRSFPSAIEAESDLEALLIAEPSYVAAPVALESFLAAYQRSTAAAESARGDSVAEVQDEENEEHEVILPVGGSDSAADPIELDSVIDDLDHLLDESANPMATFAQAARPAANERSTAAPGDHTGGAHSVSDMFDRARGPEIRPAIEIPRAPTALPAPVTLSAGPAAAAPATPVVEAGVRAPAQPPKPVVDPPRTPLPSSKPTVEPPPSASTQSKAKSETATSPAPLSIEGPRASRSAVDRAHPSSYRLDVWPAGRHVGRHAPKPRSERRRSRVGRSVGTAAQAREPAHRARTGCRCRARGRRLLPVPLDGPRRPAADDGHIDRPVGAGGTGDQD